MKDYAEPFKEAMWLDLMKERLAEKEYTMAWFVRDMRLIFLNHKNFYKVKGMSHVLLTSSPLPSNLGDSRTLQQLYQSLFEEGSGRRGLQKKTFHIPGAGCQNEWQARQGRMLETVPGTKPILSPR